MVSTILSIYNVASCSAVLVALVGIKYVDFVNRSTTTHIELFFLNDFESPNMKSYVANFHFQLGT